MLRARPKLRLVWWSFIAIVIAWLAAIAAIELVAMFSVIYGPEKTSWDALWGMPLIFSVHIWVFALPVWLFALIPLSLFVRRSSLLWWPPVCTVCGAIAGALIVALVFHLPRPGVAPL